MIEQISVQLYPYTHFDENQRNDLLGNLKKLNIENIEVTSTIKNSWDLSGFNITGIHIDDGDLSENKIVPSLLHEGDFIFPLSSLSHLIGRKNLISIGRRIFKSQFRRPYFTHLTEKNYHNQKYWIELACWLNAQEKKITLHNHSLELTNFIDEQSPWEILHRYTTENIRFQFDPQNIFGPIDLEDILVRFHQRIDSIHLDLDDPKLTEEQKEILIEFSSYLSRPINIIIEQSKVNTNKLYKQIEKLRSLI